MSILHQDYERTWDSERKRRVINLRCPRCDEMFTADPKKVYDLMDALEVDEFLCEDCCKERNEEFGIGFDESEPMPQPESFVMPTTFHINVDPDPVVKEMMKAFGVKMGCSSCARVAEPMITGPCSTCYGHSNWTTKAGGSP